MRPSILATTIALLLVATGCAGEAGRAPRSTAEPARLPADAVAIRVDQTGGFLGATIAAAQLPLVSIYGDGRVITEGASPAIYPGPALPNLQLRRISTQEVDRLVRAALDAGVGAAIDYGMPSVTDVQTTRFAVATADGVKTTEVYALEEPAGPATKELTDAQLAARAGLNKLIERLRDASTASGASESYAVTALAAIVGDFPRQNSPDLPSPPPTLPWPGPALPGKDVKQRIVTCVTVTGDAAKAVLAAAAGANSATRWSYGGKEWVVVFRPLLPDETGCSDLTTQR